MNHCFAGPLLISNQINQECIKKCHIKLKEKDPVPSLVSPVLHTIQRLQLDWHVYTTHIYDVFKVHWKNNSIILHCSIFLRHCVYRRTKIANTDGMS
jgi:hypothetical protein